MDFSVKVKNIFLWIRQRLTWLFMDVFRWREFTDPSLMAILFALNLYIMIVSFEQATTPVALERLSLKGLTNLSFIPAPWFPDFLSNTLVSVQTMRRILHFNAEIVMLVFFFIFSRKYFLAALLTIPIFLLRTYITGLSFMSNLHSSHYFVLFFLFIFFFLPEKKSQLQLGLVFIYLTSGLNKISPSWLFGERFSSVPGYLILAPDGPIWSLTLSNLVTALEIVGAFFLLSKNNLLRNSTIVLLVLFHLYSGLLVGARFPILMLGMLGTCFLQPNLGLAEFKERSSKIIAYVFLIVLFALSNSHLLIKGGKNLTSELKFLGQFMFDARVLCEVEFNLQFEDREYLIQQQGKFEPDDRLLKVTTTDLKTGEVRSRSTKDTLIYYKGQVIHNAINLNSYFGQPDGKLCGDPYVIYRYVKLLRERVHPLRVGVKVSRSLNGHDRWFTIIDEPDFDTSKIRYDLFTHNQWIRLPDSSYPSVYHWP